MLTKIIAVAELDKKEKHVRLEATEKDCAELAARLRIPEIADIKAELSLNRKTRGVYAVSGRISGRATQQCVVTLEPVDTQLDTEFELIFAEDVKEKTGDTVLGEAAAEPVEDGVIDLGEVIVQQISLALPDYPRAEGVDFTDYLEAPEALVPPEERTQRPFANLLRQVAEEQENS